MNELVRQLTAGAAASAVFLAGFLGAALVWWLALGLAAGVYAGVVLLVPRKREAHEIEVTAGVTRAELDHAIGLCRGAAAELTKLSESPAIRAEMAESFRRLADIVAAIGEDFQADPRDLRHSRGFVDHHLGALLEIARTYAKLRAARLDAAGEQRLSAARARILGYVDRFDAIYQACLANDFQKLETSTAALDQILEIDAPASSRR